MLSNTSGLQRRSRVLGARADATTRLAKPCPQLRRRGRCKAYEAELRLRRSVAMAKEAELLAQATRLYELQCELEGQQGAEEGEEQAGRSAAPSAKAKKARVQALVQELKQEPAYLQWSLEAAVEEALVRQRLRRCPYSHRVGVNKAVKRARAEQEQQEDKKEEDSAEDEKEEESTSGSSSNSSDSDDEGEEDESDKKARRRVHVHAMLWRKERVRVFHDMTPFQRWVVLLLWQRRVQLPQKFVRDVRACLTDLATREHEHTDRSNNNNSSYNGGDNDDEALEAYLESDAFRDRLHAAEEKPVMLHTLRADVGLVDLSGLPAIIAYLSSATAQARSVLLPSTHAYFAEGEAQTSGTATKEQEEGRPRSCGGWATTRVSEKELDLSSPARAEELVEAIEYTLQLVHREGLMRRNGRRTGEVSAGTARRFPSEPIALRVLRLRRCNFTSAEPLVAALRARPLGQSLLALDLSHNRLASLRFLFVLRAAFADRLLRLALAHNPITQKPEYIAQVRRSLPRLSSLDGRPIRRPALRSLKPWLLSYTLLTPAIRSPPHDEGEDDAQHMESGNDNDDDDDLHQQHVPHITARDRQSPELQREELCCVRDVVARLFYIWERRLVPPTVAEMNRIEEETRNEVESDEDDDDEEGKDDEEVEVSSSVATHHTRSSSSSSSSQQQQQQEEQKAKEKKKKSRREGGGVAALMADKMIEEEMTEDTFAARYLHPSATFSLTMVPGLSFFDPATMRLDREVELDASFTGMRLSPHDLHDLRNFDVGMRNASRNLLQGRPALARFGRGAQNCFLAYQSTIYPARMEVTHGIASAIVSVVKVPPRHTTTTTTTTHHESNEEKDTKSKDKAATRAGTLQATTPSQARDVAMYVVTIHGTMRWQLPSMLRGGQAVVACYDRVLTLCEKWLPGNAGRRAWERLRSPPLVLYSDQLHLRPVPTESAWCSWAYSPNTTQRLTRLVIEYGLEACQDGSALVRAVMTWSTSEAAEQAALEVLVFGPATPTEDDEQEGKDDDKRRKKRENKSSSEDAREELPAHVQAANEAARRVVRRFLHSRRTAKEADGEAQVSQQEQGGDEKETVYHIVSLLGREEASVDETRAFVEDEREDDTKEGGRGRGQIARPRRTRRRTRWGSTPHTVTHALLMAVVQVMNTHYTTEIFCRARMDVVGEL